MGNVIPFPKEPHANDSEAPGGTVHVWHLHDGGGFEVAHESRSGNSWGGFSQWDCPRAAIAAAHRLNAEMGGDCEVFIPREVMLALNAGVEVQF